MVGSATSTFRALSNTNYRLWAIGALVSNVGTWMQRVAQDWLVLTELTEQRASAVGIVMGLQFGPQLLFLPWSGFVADRVDRRMLLAWTQAAQAALAFSLGALTLLGWVTLWHVYMFAFLLGTVTAFDAPARQVFVTDLVDDSLLTNAVALNATSFHAARMIGPALAGLLLALHGPGWLFLVNGASFLAVLTSLALLRTRSRKPRADAHQASKLSQGFIYVLGRKDLMTILLMLFLIGTFGFNFPIYIATMSVKVFNGDASQYGLLTSSLAVGSVTGALFAARRATPSMRLLATAALCFAGGLFAAAVSPNPISFAIALLACGFSALTFAPSTNSLMQLTTAPEMRGRVMALRVAVALGGTPLGAPLVGFIVDHFGARWGFGVGIVGALVAAAVAFRYLAQSKTEVT